MDNNYSPGADSWQARLRQHAIDIFQAGVEAADPYKAVKNSLQIADGQLKIALDSSGPDAFRSGAWKRIHLISFGKAACTMAAAAQEIIPGSLRAGDGIAVTNYENVTEVPGFEVIGAGHPLPDEAGFGGAQRVAECADSAEEGDLVLVLVSGGGSALVPFPPDSISLEDKIATTRVLLACGADINEINCVRKHLSRLKGGGLARLSAPADVHALILSDVLGDDLSSIASGPTVPDPTTYHDAMRVFQSKFAWYQLPAAIRTHLEDGFKGRHPETPKPDDTVFDSVGHTLIGSNRISVDAIVSAAGGLQLDTELYSDELCGEAREEAARLARHVKPLLESGLQRPLALLAGGETTVTLRGSGRGGRNQEMALAFALAAEEIGLPPRWVFLSGGTDGRDGPTDAAGGMVDPGTLERMRASGLNPAEHLDNNDSYAALKQSDDLLDTGATGTNVADLQVLILNP